MRMMKSNSEVLGFGPISEVSNDPVVVGFDSSPCGDVWLHLFDGIELGDQGAGVSLWIFAELHEDPQDRLLVLGGDLGQPGQLGGLGDRVGDQLGPDAVVVEHELGDLGLRLGRAK